MGWRKHALVLAASLGLVVGLVACSTVRVSTDYDPTVNFAQYKTFSFMPMVKFDAITAGRVETAITRALQGRGLQRAPGTVDLQISVRGRISREQQITTFGCGWGRGWRGGISTATVQNVSVGTLVVDLVDASANRLVWRGMASDTINRTSTGQEKQNALDDAMVRLFAKYPPGPGQ